MKMRSLLFLVFAFAAPCAGAQVVVATSPQLSKMPAGGLADRISINLDRVPFIQALDDIARQARVKITITASAMKVNKRVTLSVKDVSAQEVFKAALEGTPVQMSVEQDGQVVFSGVRSRNDGRGQGVIAGKVTDAKTGKGISAANVSIGSDSRAAVSGEDGAYRIAGVAGGTYTITVRMLGYAKQSRSITVGEGATINADFKLEPGASVLDQVIVTGTIARTELRAVPNAITIITAKQIEERGITRIDQLFRGDIPGLFSANMGSTSGLEEVVMYARGATALSSGSSGVSVTGNTNPIKTYIDGVEMVNPKYLSQIDPSTIERIEILSGPQASTIYGSNAINGVMQIFTKRGKGGRPQLMVNWASGIAQSNFSSSLAPNHLGEAQVNGVEGRFSYQVGGSWNYIGSWTPSINNQRLNVNGGIRTDARQLTIDFNARHATTRNKVSGTGEQEMVTLRTNGMWDPNATAGVMGRSLNVLSGSTLGMTLEYHPFSWWTHELVFGSDESIQDLRKLASTYDPSFSGTGSDTTLSLTISSQRRRSERYTTTTQVNISESTRLNITLGADHWRTYGTVVSAFPSSLTGTLASPGITRDRPGKNSGGFVQGQLSLYDALFITYGLRSEWNPNYGDNVNPNLAPRYGASYTREMSTPLGTITAKLRGSYGRATRPPSVNLKFAGSPQGNATIIREYGQFNGRVANLDLGPESQQGGEGGVELYFGNLGSLVVTRYNQTVDNLISLINPADSVRSLAPNPTTWSSPIFDSDGYGYRYQSQYINVGNIRNQGWELQGSVNTGALTTRGTYSWTKSRIIGITPRYKALLTGVAFTPGRPFDYLPEHTWAIGTTYAQAKSTVNLSVNGIGKLFRALDNGDDLFLAARSFSRLTATRPRMELNSYRPVGAGYATADLNATHRVNSGIEMLVQIHNLTNYYQNDFNYGYASTGRQSKIGIRLKL